VAGAGGELLERLRAIPKKLEDVTDRIFQGLKTSADKIYIVEEKARSRKGVRVFSRQTESEHWLEPDLLHPLIKGGDSRRYSLTTTSRLILFPYASDESGSMSLISAQILKSRYPLTWEYLSKNKDYLQDREDGRMRGDKWFGYIYPKALDVMGLPKIFTPDIAARAAFSLDETGEVFFTGGVAGGYGLLVSEGHDRLFILGLLNSRVLEWFIRQTATRMRGGYFSFEARFIRSLPIKAIDPKSTKEKAVHDDMVRLVKELTGLKKRLVNSKTPHERTQLERQADAADREIDQLVYSLYGLSSSEVALVEKDTTPPAAASRPD
jgi:hypothetical protein